MIDFTIETEFGRPAPEVFSLLADPSRLGDWQDNTVSATVEGGGPLAPGSRIHEVHRAPGGRRLASVVEVAEIVPPRRLVLRVIEGSLPVDAEIDLVPADAGTLLRFRAHGRVDGPARVFEPLLRVGLRRQFRRQCTTLKAIVEAEARAPASEGAEPRR